MRKPTPIEAVYKKVYIIIITLIIFCQEFVKIGTFLMEMTNLTQEMYRTVNRAGDMPVKKLGRRFQYVDREVVAISLPRKAIDKVEELRGKQPKSNFLTELVCEKLGIKEEDIYVKC